jgi:glycosyltransferase involved in cell wall biosynthesis
MKNIPTGWHRPLIRGLRKIPDPDQLAPFTGSSLRILYHHRTAALDGMSVHIERLVSALRARGHEVRVVGPTSGEMKAGGRGQLEKLSDALRAILPAAAFELLELAYNIPAYRRLKREAKAFRPDILYERNNLYLLAGLWLKRSLGLPMILEINAPLFEERNRFGKLKLKAVARRAERALWAGADVALPVTQVLADMVARVRGTNDMHVIHNGADLDDVPPPDSDLRARLGLEDKVVLGFVGFVRPWHGLEWAIRALPRLGSNVDLLVVGDGPAQESLEKEAEALGVKRRVHFVGRVPHQDIASYIQAFDIALQTKAVAYASPLKMFEYMALARAIIAPDQPNLREILKPDIDALLFDPADETSFFNALERMSRDAELRARLGDAARRSVEETPFTWAENARRVEAFATALLAKSARAKAV